MRFGISIPQFVADGTFDPAGMRRYLTRAEELGFDSGWVASKFWAPCRTSTRSAR